MLLQLLTLAADAQTAPTVAPCTVLRPTYTIDGKSVSTGLMFAATVGADTVLVTAHSNFGPAGGLTAQLAPADMGKVASVVARDAFAFTTECARSTKVRSIADAAPMGNGADGSRDVAAFTVTKSTLDKLPVVPPPPLVPLAWADKVPKVGDVVYMLGPVVNQRTSTHPAKVVEANAGFVFFSYDDRTVDLTATTGAPIVNAEGKVVGINLGAGKMDDGALIGSAAPLVAVKQRVEASTSPAK